MTSYYDIYELVPKTNQLLISMTASRMRHSMKKHRHSRQNISITKRNIDTNQRI